MEVHFPVNRVNSLRRAAARAGKFPDKCPKGWTKSPVDPMHLLRVFKELHLKPGYVLRAYSYFDGGNGNAVLYAMLTDAPFPEPAECPRNTRRFLEPPVPAGAVEASMRLIEGDGSPWSYVSASIFARELAEFGAIWHGCSWSTHTILAGKQDADRVEDARMANADSWTWLEPEPADWRPLVAGENGRVTVTFYTHTALGSRRIIRHVDTYRQPTYRFNSEETVIAEGGQGYVF